MRRAGGWTGWRRRCVMWLLPIGVIVGYASPAWAPPAEAQFIHTQITSTANETSEPSLNNDGTRIAFISYADLTPDNPGNADHNSEIFLWTEGAGFTQITNTTGGDGSFEPSLNADGTRIAFRSTRNLTPDTPGNVDGNSEIFLWTEGAGFTQITNTTGGNNTPGGSNSVPSLNADGTRIAFRSNRHQISVGFEDANQEIFLWTQESGLIQITNTIGSASDKPSINADGTRIAFRSYSDLIFPARPGNADGNWEIFLWTEGSSFMQITNTTGGHNLEPTLSADGTRIAFVSTHDLIPDGNQPGNEEIFLWTEGSGFTQITNTTGDDNAVPSINADGTRIAFVSSADLIFPGSPGNADGNYEIFLWTEGFGFAQITNTTGGYNLEPTLSADGTRIAFTSFNDLTPGSPGNPDGSEEIFLSVQADTTPALFAFTDVIGVPLSTVQTSNAITVIGITAPAAMSIVGGEYEVNGSGTWSSSARTVSNGDTVRVRHTSAATYATAVHTTLIVGGVADIFASTTLAGDTTPDPFAFTDVTGVPLSTVQTSNAITVTGITAPAAMSIVGGEYEVNSSGIWSSSASTVSNGNTVRVRHTSAATYSTAIHTTLIVGGVADIFASTTLAGPAVGPDLTGTWDSVGQSWSKGRYTLRSTVRVVNQGTTTASASRLRIFLSDDAVLDPSDEILKEFKIKKRKRGQGKTKEIKRKLPDGESAAGKYLFAVIDVRNDVDESDETNNTLMIGPFL